MENALLSEKLNQSKTERSHCTCLEFHVGKDVITRDIKGGPGTLMEM